MQIICIFYVTLSTLTDNLFDGEVITFNISAISSVPLKEHLPIFVRVPVRSPLLPILPAANMTNNCAQSQFKVCCFLRHSFFYLHI